MSPFAVLTSVKPRLAVIAAAAAILAAGVAGPISIENAGAASGGVASPTSDASTAQGPSGTSAKRYDRLWKRFSFRDRRWAHRTSECESGSDPNAIGGGGLYRGAFQFMKSTWNAAPKSPGGDPVAYTYRTQAVVAILLMKRDGRGAWPVCG